MTTRRIIIWAGSLALLTEFICFVLFLGCPLFGPLAYIGIALLYPAMLLWRLLLPVTPEALNVIALLLLPFLQFFLVIWATMWAVLRFKRKR